MVVVLSKEDLLHEKGVCACLRAYTKPTCITHTHTHIHTHTLTHTHTRAHTHTHTATCACVLHDCVRVVHLLKSIIIHASLPHPTHSARTDTTNECLRQTKQAQYEWDTASSFFLLLFWEKKCHLVYVLAESCINFPFYSYCHKRLRFLLPQFLHSFIVRSFFLRPLFLT